MILEERRTRMMCKSEQSQADYKQFVDDYRKMTDSLGKSFPKMIILIAGLV